MSKVIIYILCPDNEKLSNSQKIYKKYEWAKPILLKYNQPIILQENSFWKQLSEISNEWDNCDMVGTLSNSAYKKINLDEVDELIKYKLYFPNQYYHFMDSNFPIPNTNTNKHPYFNDIWYDMLNKLNLKTTTENCCNYWMCSPKLMKEFIPWFTEKCLPELLKNPYIFLDAKYTDTNWNTIIDENKLIDLWGKPYYPHLPFVVERLNKCFFETYYPEHIEKFNFDWVFYTNNYNDLKYYNKIRAKHHYYKHGQFENRIYYNYNIIDDSINLKSELTRYNNLLPRFVFLIAHDKNVGGAQNCLFNLKYIYDNDNIKTELIYLQDINFNITEYILNKSKENNCFPVVFCNTLCCAEIVLKLSKMNILTYWYIHEWYDNFTAQFFNKYISHLSIFNSHVNLIFVCNASLNNYNFHIKNLNNKKHIIYNTYFKEVLDKKLNESISFVKDKNYLYLSIIGTVEKRKNQQQFIDEVFYNLKNKYSNIKLIIVGEEREKLHINNYHNDIHIIGKVDNALPYINISDILISYSINEVLPMNIIEALYCEKPVVSTNVGGINEIIEDNYNGFLIELNESTKCHNILSNLIEDNELMKNMGKNAKNTFFKKFESSIVKDKFLSLLRYE